MSADIGALFDQRDSLEIAALVKAGEVSASELAEEAIGRIEALNPTLNAVSIPLFDYGRKAAADPALPDGPFKGVPFLLKDLGTLWEGIPLANSCRYFKDFVCPADMTYTRRIKEAGFVLLGRSNAPELGWCLATEPALFGRANNPWDLERTPGGSSGGAAAPAAARRRRWRRAWCPSWMRATARARRGCRPPTAGWSGSSPRGAGSRSTLSPTTGTAARASSP